MREANERTTSWIMRGRKVKSRDCALANDLVKAALGLCLPGDPRLCC